MIKQVIINDNTKTPLRYLPKLKNFGNGTGFEFKPGINIIVGENGSGKSTLLKLIQSYLLVDKVECGRGIYNSMMTHLFRDLEKTEMLDGADVFADYDNNTFRLCHASEKTNDDVLKNFESFGTFFQQKRSSTGENVLISMSELLEYIFSKKVKLKFDYSQFAEEYPAYIKYVSDHKVSFDENEYTVIMDEPDRNLDINNVGELLKILTCRKEHMQLIAVVHNPLIIYGLGKQNDTDINFIEMSPDYVQNVLNTVNGIVA